MKEGMEAWARAWEAELSLSGLRCRWGGRAEILEREYWATVDCVEDVMAGQSGEGRRFYGLWDRWRKGRLEKTGMGKESRKAVEEEITGMVIQYLEKGVVSEWKEGGEEEAETGEMGGGEVDEGLH
jgi:hypothetical protein